MGTVNRENVSICTSSCRILTVSTRGCCILISISKDIKLIQVLLITAVKWLTLKTKHQGYSTLRTQALTAVWVFFKPYYNQLVGLCTSVHGQLARGQLPSGHLPVVINCFVYWHFKTFINSKHSNTSKHFIVIDHNLISTLKHKNSIIISIYEQLYE